jgi:hypothetical protein
MFSWARRNLDVVPIHKNTNYENDHKAFKNVCPHTSHATVKYQKLSKQMPTEYPVGKNTHDFRISSGTFLWALAMIGCLCCHPESDSVS